jgi:hypothetical protein
VADLAKNPTHSVSLPCFPPTLPAASSSATSVADLITKAEKALQAFTLLGHTVDFVAAAKVIIAAAMTPGATWVTIVEAIVGNLAVIFPVAPPAPAQVHAVLSLAA